MGSPAQDAPPPPGREFVLFLALIAVVGVAIGKLVIAPWAGPAYIFVLATICFLAPLIGWGVTVAVGKHLWRQGDFIPVGMLFISLLCGIGIFKAVVIDEYDPGFAKELRFNWFEIAGDGANDASGAQTLSDAEYAQLGLKMLAARVLKNETQPLASDFNGAEVAHEAAIFWDRPDRPRLSAFNANAPDAGAQFDALPESFKRQILAWLTKAKIAERIAQEAHAAKIVRLRAELAKVASTRRRASIQARIEGLVERALPVPVALQPWDLVVLNAAQKSLAETLAGFQERNGAGVVGGVQSYDAAKKAIVAFQAKSQAFGGHNVARPRPASDSAEEATRALEVSATELGAAFGAAEQSLLDWRYAAHDPALPAEASARGDFLAYPVDLSKAKDKNFQAFAVGIYIDNVTAITLGMVTLLAFLIHLFSVGYMHGEVRYTRFMATINLFTAGMIGLVLANSFLWLFVCWEIMGLCSYLLIGHYFEKKSAQEASLKAFFTTRIADTLMFIGMMMIFAYTSTLLFAGSPDATAAMEATGFYLGDVTYAGSGSFFALLGQSEVLIGGVGAFMIGLLCFLGPAGKSAQFPFHVWLPDAMEGPTPVSAMIHAACMVSAGVYLTARLFPLFTPEVLEIIALVGGFTALMAGTIGLVQTDLKKVLAYSTISQLGYMFLGIGVGSWYPALFHMLAHAFFKALMFLGSGSVILGCHHEQEMPKMGGLWKKMPITAITFWIGNLSIIGLPFFFAAYYSKEAILTDSILFGKAGGMWLPYIFGALGAGLTTFYMLRLMWLTFHGKPRDKHLYDHVKESPWTITVPLVVIAIASLLMAWPIGAAADPSVNLGITHISQTMLAGSEAQGVNADGSAKKRPQDESESDLAYLMWKEAAAFSKDFMRAEYPDVKPPLLDRLYADKHGRTAFGGKQAWRQHDLVVVSDFDSFYRRGHDDTAQELGPAKSAAGAGDAARDDWSIVDGHSLHAFHQEHRDAHIIALMFSLVMLGLGIGFSVFLYLGPLAGKDFVGHHGFRYRLKKVLQAGYNVDAFYAATVLRANRWLRQLCAWFDRTLIDGVINLVGAVGRWQSRVVAKIDFWGVDGSVRGVSNATEWSGRQAQRATTGKIQDYVFLLVAGIVILFVVLVLFR